MEPVYELVLPWTESWFQSLTLSWFFLRYVTYYNAFFRKIQDDHHQNLDISLYTLNKYDLGTLQLSFFVK